MSELAPDPADNRSSYYPNLPGSDENSILLKTISFDPETASNIVNLTANGFRHWGILNLGTGEIESAAYLEVDREAPAVQVYIHVAQAEEAELVPEGSSSELIAQIAHGDFNRADWGRYLIPIDPDQL